MTIKRLVRYGLSIATLSLLSTASPVAAQQVTADESYLRESILTPQLKLVAGYQPLMPTFQGLINEEGLASLLEHIKSLSAPGRAQTSAAQASAAAAAPAVEGRNP